MQYALLLVSSLQLLFVNMPRDNERKSEIVYLEFGDCVAWRWDCNFERDKGLLLLHASNCAKNLNLIF
jgi:hypothetical protein